MDYVVYYEKILWDRVHISLYYCCFINNVFLPSNKFYIKQLVYLSAKQDVVDQKHLFFPEKKVLRKQNKINYGRAKYFLKAVYNFNKFF